MQSHASIHVVSEFLKDLHPDLSEPFPKVSCSHHGAANCSLCKPSAALLPVQEVIKDEIAVAYGRRSVPKVTSTAWLLA
jgi:hypothetical protein